jgi:hypothetical protein
MSGLFPDCQVVIMDQRLGPERRQRSSSGCENPEPMKVRGLLTHVQAHNTQLNTTLAWRFLRVIPDKVW